jgi:hypothetical protein
MKIEYRVLLYSETHSKHFYEYSTCYLPLLGDIIEIETARTLFQINDRLLVTNFSGHKVLYVLYGTFVGEQVSQLNLDNLKMRLSNVVIDIETNSYGKVLFPDDFKLIIKED